MVLKLKEYTMASLGYKSSENPLISLNQTRPSPFSSLKHRTPLSFSFSLFPHFSSPTSLILCVPACSPATQGPTATAAARPSTSLLSLTSLKPISFSLPASFLLCFFFFRRTHGRQRRTRDKVRLFLSISILRIWVRFRRGPMLGFGILT